LLGIAVKNIEKLLCLFLKKSSVIYVVVGSFRFFLFSSCSLPVFQSSLLHLFFFLKKKKGRGEERFCCQRN